MNAKVIEDLDLDGVERIRDLIAAKQLEVTPAELMALARRRVDLMSKGWIRARRIRRRCPSASNARHVRSAVNRLRVPGTLVRS